MYIPQLIGAGQFRRRTHAISNNVGFENAVVDSIVKTPWSQRIGLKNTKPLSFLYKRGDRSGIRRDLSDMVERILRF